MDPRDVPAEKAARRIGLSLAEFEERKYALFDRGFPQPDETTGLYDLEAIDRWRHLRYPHLFPEIPEPAFVEGRDRPRVRNAQKIIEERIRRLGEEMDRRPRRRKPPA